jgi:lysophospholipase L1-like esterase
MRGAAAALTERVNNIVVDAMVSRQAGAAIRLLKDQYDARRLGSIVIVHIGNNGFFTAQQFDQMMQVLTDVPRVLFINLRVPRRWEQPNNAVLADGVKRYPNAELVDWYAASANRPELFTADGVHLQPDGRRVYVELIAAQLAHTGQASR